MKPIALIVPVLLSTSLARAMTEPPAAEEQSVTAEAAEGEKAPPGDAAKSEAEESRFHLTLGADITTAYFFRGMNQEDSGFILQPYADLSLDVVRGEDATLSVIFGTWNSFQSQATGSDAGDSFRKTWYEDDLYAGLGLEAGKWTLDARYYFYTSPSDAFETIEEFDLTIGFDDSEFLGAWALNPSVLLAVETGSDASDGVRPGTYLQLGITPGFKLDSGPAKDVELSFPVLVGLSLSNYYQDAEGDNDAFGFASVGAKADVPLGLDKSWGEWKLSAGLQVLFLGDATANMNNGDHEEVIGTVGVSVTF